MSGNQLSVETNLFAVEPEKAEVVKRIRVTAEGKADAIVQRGIAAFSRQVAARCEARVVDSGEAALTVSVRIDPTIGKEGYVIADGSQGTIRVTGNEAQGVVYGLGKLLRISRYDRGGFMPGNWRGKSVPDKPIRGTYFCVHYFNFFHVAPMEEVKAYIEDQALWGSNSLLLWFDMSHFSGFADPAAKVNADRLREMLRTAADMGMEPALALIANYGFTSSPKELRAKMIPCAMGTEMCPNKPEAYALMLKQFEEMLALFSDARLQRLTIGGIDPGGCACEKCAPWGCNGYLKMVEAEAKVARRLIPGVKIGVGTWRMNDQELEGLDKVLANRPDWVDFVFFTKGTEGSIGALGSFGQEWLSSVRAKEKREPLGGLPLVNFPEISMQGNPPPQTWGGCGVNVLAWKIKAEWDRTKANYAGGWPYMEGIYCDINQAVCLMAYWDGSRTTEDILKEYIAYQYSPEVVSPVLSALRTLENGGDKAAAFQAIKEADTKLTPLARQSWPWRVLYIRSQLDAERQNNGGKFTKECREPIEELVRLYHAENAHNILKPPLGGVPK